MSSKLPDILPVFPLPDVVLFPATVMPLHIFEPRYREMMKSALDGPRIIVMVLLKPGWEEDYPGNPPIYDLACAGRIASSHRQPDGRYLTTLLGLTRVRILEEIQGAPFRRARVEVLSERKEWLRTEEAGREVRRLLSRFHRLQGHVQIKAGGPDAGSEPAAREVTLNTMAMHLEVDGAVRQSLLEQDDLAERARLTGEILTRALREREILRRRRDLKPDDPRMN
jgi:hypothetical protein